MAASGRVGTVAGLWRFPVKSMGGERIDRAELSERGMVGDRAFALVDVDTGKVASAKSVKLFPGLLRCRAEFVEPPEAGRDLPPVRITLADGRTVMSDARDANGALSAYFGRQVTLSRMAPEDYTIDQFHPDIENVDPAGYRNTFVEQKLGSAFFAEAGVPSPVPVGAFLDLFPVSVLSTSTVAQLNALQPQSRFDERRFRMNVIVDTTDAGFPENEWVGKSVALGDTVRLQIALPDPRCVMTTLERDELPSDAEVLRTLVRYNRLQVGASGLYPCAGVYAVVQTAGPMRSGDSVVVAS